MSDARDSPGLTHPRSGCVGILSTRTLWYRICPSRTAFGVEGAGRRGAAVLAGASARPQDYAAIVSAA